MQAPSITDFSLQRKQERTSPQSTNAYAIQTSTMAQAHLNCMPPVTSNWNLEAMPWKITSTELSKGGIMQFTAHAANQNMHQRMFLHQKRKSEMNPLLPSKQFISEEKITQHFNGMHISSNYTEHNAGNVSITSMADDTDDWNEEYSSYYSLDDYQTASKALEEKLQRANGIIFSEELKRFNANHGKVSQIPQALLRRTENPCTALVLWQPPPVNIFNTTSVINRNSNIDSMDVRRSDDRCFSNIDATDTVEFRNFPHNNNTCNVDFNNSSSEGMDEDL